MLTFENLSKTNKERCEKEYHKINDWSLTDWGCALGGEAGECLNLVKKLRRLDNGENKPYNDMTREDIVKGIRKELADIVIYADLLATRLGQSLGDCVVEKFNETSIKINSPLRLVA